MKRRKGILAVMVLLLSAMLSISARSQAVPITPNLEMSTPPSFQIDRIRLLDDSNYPYRREFFGFDIRAFLRDHAPVLAQYRGPVLSSQDDVAEMVELVAHFHGINPKVLITLMEIQAQLLSQPPLDNIEEWVLGYKPQADDIGGEGIGLCPGDGKWFFTQLILMARRLNDGYFSWHPTQEESTGAYPMLTFADGSRLPVPAGANAATFAILYALAQASDPEQWQELVADKPGGFRPTYLNLFEEDPLQVADIHTQAGPYPGTIQFPWPNGQSWCYSRGPHDNALDFAPGGGIGCLESKCFNNWIVAADSGTVVDTSHLWIKIDHGDGWMTGYFHTPGQDKIAYGAKPCRGEQIGHPGCCGDDGCTYCMPCGDPCPGCCASGTHTHFALYKDGAAETWVGKTISGWTVLPNGCLEKSGETKCPNSLCPGGSWITSDTSKDCCCCSGSALSVDQGTSACGTGVVSDQDEMFSELIELPMSVPGMTEGVESTTSWEAGDTSEAAESEAVQVSRASVEPQRIPPTSANYRIVKSVFGSGGGEKTSTHYVMNSTQGQSTALRRRQSASYALVPGYWGRWIPSPYEYGVYLPLVVKGH